MSKVCWTLFYTLLSLGLASRATVGATNGPPQVAFTRIIHGWTNYSTGFNATHDTAAQSDYATVASFYTPAEDVKPLEYAAIFISGSSGTPNFAPFDYRVFIWSSLSAFIQEPRQGDLATFHFGAPTGGSTTVRDATTRGGRPAYELRFALSNAPITLSNGHTYLIGVAALADTRAGELFVPTASHDGPSDVQAGDLVTGGWIYLVDAGGNTIYSGQLATELVVQSVVQSPPALHMSRSNQTVKITWPVSATGFTLEYAFNLSPGTEWFPVEVEPAAENGSNQVVIPVSFTRQFFRLRR